jgi:hypothetical protein
MPSEVQAGTSRTPRFFTSGTFDELLISVHRDRWGLGLCAVAWVHLATFLACEALYVSGDRRSLPYLALWGAELFTVVWILRRVVTANGRRSAPVLTGLLARVWITFLILKFNAVSLNTLMGMDSMAQEWFKPMWGTLGTFGFAMMAWLTTPWFLVLAVQMSLTATLIVKFPLHGYLIYGVSWFIALNVVGLVLERKRIAALARTRIATTTAIRPIVPADAA